eukprot:TRINITY_DN666_c0_g1_i2.p3 TRINITY_DN666_c0_g1~~TRINITY_DN666_c0_g1_i2.p3  ORF type:complete len:147 (+),score=70.03 TRINITY_DN666_c0_g1_i2:63-503(+)
MALPMSKPMKAMKTAMKTMKTAMKKKTMKAAMKAMKSMKKAMKAMKVSKIARGKRAKAAVLSGRKEKTSSGLKKTDLKKSKTGRIVSVKKSAVAKKNFAGSALQKWGVCTKKARKELGFEGKFVPLGGKTRDGKALLARTRELYEA